MSVRTDHLKDGGVFFCTFTCFRWLPMIARVSMYEWVYAWFLRLHADGERMVGYVIMPNHLHILLLVQEGHSINRILGEGKRFMAYEIRKRLVAGDHQDMLTVMDGGVRAGDADRGQRYRVFETSSDIKECWSAKFLHQKLDYIHKNPISGKWSLVADPAMYAHSSAGFYMLGTKAPVPLLHLGVLL